MPRSSRLLAPALLAGLAGCASAPAAPTAAAPAVPSAPAVGDPVRALPVPGGDSVRPRPAAGPLTRAERTGYAETSTHADVVAFLDSLAAAVRARGGTLPRGTIGRTDEGRELPYVVASRPAVATPEAARALGRPIVYVQGNIHGGEVEGKEALQMLLRDLLLDERPNALDSIVLVAVPIYNADGNERWGPQARQRGAQNGPASVGQRPNAQSLDLNRDYVKAEAPETRASLAMFDRWAPHVFVDLHTTNGSYHGYALTYAPSLHPAAPLGEWTRTALLPELRRRVAERHGYPTYDYGNFADDGGGASLGDPAKAGWFTYDHRQRFGTNYYGLRGGVAVLSEAYSHDPFGRRVASTYAFVRELLGVAGEQGASLVARVEEARRAAPAGEVPLRAALAEDAPADWIAVERLEATGDTTRTEPGGPRGFRRTGRYEARRMAAATFFRPTLREAPPAGWALPASDTAAVRLLRLHGVEVRRLAEPWSGPASAFVVDSAIAAARPFQGHREVRIEGRWQPPAERTLPAGTFVVASSHPLGRLAFLLLDPRSDDGLATWNAFDDRLRPGGEFPVLRLTGAVPASARPLD